MNCLVCQGPATDRHHFPRAIGMGRKRKKVGGLIVPLCRVCHTETHAGHHTEVLIEEAPGYWQAVGADWEQTFDTWVSGRRLREVGNEE